MPPRLSAVEAISPSFARTKQQLFKPVRAGRWVRLAVVSLVTGEFVGGGGYGGGNISLPYGGSKQPDESLWAAASSWGHLAEFLPWILVCIVALLALALIWIYTASIFRFILFDSVLNDRCELQESWHRWQKQGSSYFLWSIGLGLAILFVLGAIFGGAIYLVVVSRIFDQAKEHIGLLVVGGIVLLFLVIAIVVVGLLASLFAKDFAVPLMALDDLGILDAWRRLLPLLAAEKAAYAGYVLMKMILAVGSAIVFGIINLIVFLGLLIPLGIAGLVLYSIWKVAALTWNAYTISAAVALGLAVLIGLLYVVALVSTPATVFFQAYTLHFFGSRYPVLGALMFLTPPGPPTPPAIAPSTAG